MMGGYITLTIPPPPRRTPLDIGTGVFWPFFAPIVRLSELYRNRFRQLINLFILNYLHGTLQQLICNTHGFQKNNVQNGFSSCIQPATTHARYHLTTRNHCFSDVGHVSSKYYSIKLIFFSRRLRMHVHSTFYNYY